MSRYITPDQTKAWYALFESFEQSGYRLEGLQTYTSPPEAEPFERFLAGKPLGVEPTWWIGIVTGHKEAGTSMSRVRIVREPLTDYTRFEFAVYPMMAAAGEDIRVIVANGDEPTLPDHDYWLFDDTDLWMMEYEGAGVFVGARLIEDKAVVARHCEWRDTAMASSVPLDQYLSTLDA